jgi:hypothetical protein
MNVKNCIRMRQPLADRQQFARCGAAAIGLADCPNLPKGLAD